MCAEVGLGHATADDADCFVPESEGGFAKMKAVIVTVLETAGLTASEKKTETVLVRTLSQVLPTSPPVVEATCQTYMHTMQLLYLGGLVYANVDIMPWRSNGGSDSRGHATIVSTRAVRYGGFPVHVKGAPAIKIEVMETLL